MNSSAVEAAVAENRRHFAEDVVFPIEQLADNDIICWDEFVVMLQKAFRSLEDSATDTRGITPQFLVETLEDTFGVLDPLFLPEAEQVTVTLRTGGSVFVVDCKAIDTGISSDSDDGWRTSFEVRLNP